MIQVCTARPDTMGKKPFEEIAKNVFLNRDTGEVLITDGDDEAIIVTTSISDIQ